MRVFVFAVLLPASLGGCASTLPADILPFRSPAAADVGIRDTHHHNAIGDYHHREPVDPRNWRQLNDEQARDQVGAS